MTKPEKQKSIPVASLKSLSGAAPEFMLPVKIKRLDGEAITINFTAKALRKKEWAKMRDAFIAPVAAASDDAEEAAPVEKFTFTAAIDGDMHKGADLVSQFTTGWDLEDAFNADSLMDMEDQFGGSLGAVLQAYDAAIFHGRLGN